MRALGISQMGSTALVALALLAVETSAQSHAPSAAGVRMRVLTASGAPVAGRLVAWGTDSLVLLVDGTERAYATGSLVRVETFAGRRSQAWRGAKLGLVIGMVAGVALGIAEGDDAPGWFAMTAGEKALAGGVGLGLLGMGIGAGIGAASGADHWEPAALPGAAADLARGGTRIGARIGGRIAF